MSTFDEPTTFVQIVIYMTHLDMFFRQNFIKFKKKIKANYPLKVWFKQVEPIITYRNGSADEWTPLEWFLQLVIKCLPFLFIHCIMFIAYIITLGYTTRKIFKSFSQFTSIQCFIAAKNSVYKQPRCLKTSHSKKIFKLQ